MCGAAVLTGNGFANSITAGLRIRLFRDICFRDTVIGAGVVVVVVVEVVDLHPLEVVAAVLEVVEGLLDVVVAVQVEVGVV
jgi:hypothetical protein